MAEGVAAMCESFGDGDTDGLSGRAPATPAASIGQVQFTQDEARITIIKVPETYDFSDGKYFFKRASQQCIERLLQHPPATFHAELKGTNREPHLEVVLQTSAVKLLPLLSDIHEEAIASEQPDGVTVPFNPPCSVWSLVTVLLLLEGDVTIEAWLGNLEHDVTLAARTLEVRPNLHLNSRYCAAHSTFQIYGLETRTPACTGFEALSMYVAVCLCGGLDSTHITRSKRTVLSHSPPHSHIWIVYPHLVAVLCHFIRPVCT